LAIQIAYQFTMSPKDMADPRALDRFWREQAQTGEGSREYFEKLIYGMSGSLPQIDTFIQESLKNWRFDRLDKMDLAVLRIAAYEMFFEKVPPAVAINEAVELSKKYGNKDSPSFVNGILDSLKMKVPA
jgi:N utilization substance protein B